MPRPPHKMLKEVIAKLKNSEMKEFKKAKKNTVTENEIPKKSAKKPLETEMRGRGLLSKSEEYQPKINGKNKKK